MKRLRAVLLAAVVATAAQLAMISWRAGGEGGYTANEDERFYYSLVVAAAREPLSTSNPFDREWHRAAPSSTRLLSVLVAVPIRLGISPELLWDAARWLGSFCSALLLMAIGGMIASTAAGAAAAVLVQLDPGAFYGKPLLSLLGTGVHHAGDPHQLIMSRALVPSLTLPLFLLAIWGVLILSRRGHPRGTGSWRVTHHELVRLPSTVYLLPSLSIAAVGLTGHLFTWSGALAAAIAAAVMHQRRRMMFGPVVLGAAFAGAIVALGGMGRHGAPLEDILLRVGSIRTHRPLFLTHTGFWAGAIAAALLAFAPGRIRSAARALGAATLGAWALALLHTPVFGWDIESFHFAHVMGPLSTLSWCALLWHVRHRFSHPTNRISDHPTNRLSDYLTYFVVALVCIVAFAGPIRARQGFGASIAEGAQRRAEMREHLGRVSLPAGSAVLVPEELRVQLAATHAGVTFAAPYQMLWSVPDSVLFDRAVCAGALLGMDSAEVHRRAAASQAGNLAVWHWGRPRDVATDAIRSYFDIFDALAVRLSGAVAEAARSVPVLQRYCAVRPDFVLPVGKLHVRRATAAVTQLGGSVSWSMRDEVAWLSLSP